MKIDCTRNLDGQAPELVKADDDVLDPRSVHRLQILRNSKNMNLLLLRFDYRNLPRAKLPFA